MPRHETENIAKQICHESEKLHPSIRHEIRVHLLRANRRQFPYRRRLGDRRWPALRTPITPNATSTPTATNCCGLNPAHVDKSPRKKSSPNLIADTPPRYAHHLRRNGTISHTIKSRNKEHASRPDIAQPLLRNARPQRQFTWQVF